MASRPHTTPGEIIVAPSKHASTPELNIVTTDKAIRTTRCRHGNARNSRPSSSQLKSSLKVQNNNRYLRNICRALLGHTQKPSSMDHSCLSTESCRERLARKTKVWKRGTSLRHREGGATGQSCFASATADKSVPYTLQPHDR